MIEPFFFSDDVPTAALCHVFMAAGQAMWLQKHTDPSATLQGCAFKLWDNNPSCQKMILSVTDLCLKMAFFFKPHKH